MGFGLQLTLVGMGVVFLLLAFLMAVLYLIGLLDRRPVPEPVAAQPAVGPAPTAVITAGGDGLDDDTIAAIAVAVIKHAEVRRKQAAPAMRTHQPGSLLHASRWLAVGRGQQNQQWRRR